MAVAAASLGATHVSLLAREHGLKHCDCDAHRCAGRAGHAGAAAARTSARIDASEGPGVEPAGSAGSPCGGQHWAVWRYLCL
jgi:hypothetical protein